MPPHTRVRRGIAYVQEGKRVFHGQTVEQTIINAFLLAGTA